ncbi:Hypp6073 [Branchiostoma lanceolatum]|uniref:Hypp6073 protein n=1 Tax=Branchiostoma lanceolatum TaxID=7740 RepID=A0A8J9YPZ6_BRALA|nr:Hypp6073 [Branchiostoma lanceolatum]
MTHIHPMSCSCTKSELDLFEVPPTQTAIQSGRWVEYHPVASLAETSPIEFDIPGAGEEFTDLSQTRLYVRAKIVRANGADLPNDAKVGPVNLWLHSLFSQVDATLGGKLVTDASNVYPYRAYLETLLNFGSEAKQTQLTSALFYQDTPGRLHLADPYPTDEGAVANEGLAKRAHMTRESREIDLLGPLHIDILFQDRYLLNKVDVKIKLHRSKHQFSLMSHGGEQYKVVISEASLFLRKVNLLPSYQLSIESQLNKQTAKYPLRRIQVKPFTIPRGNHSVSNDNLFLGQIPKRVAIALVDNAAFQGSYGTNPFNFQHFNLNHISLCVDGQEVPHKALTPNYDQGLFIRSYMNLFGPTGKQGQDCGNQIARDAFDKGYTIYCYDLSADLSGLSGDHFNVVREGNLRLELHFGQALEQTVVAVVFAEFDNLLEINRQRNISFDYSN